MTKSRTVLVNLGFIAFLLCVVAVCWVIITKEAAMKETEALETGAVLKGEADRQASGTEDAVSGEMQKNKDAGAFAGPREVGAAEKPGGMSRASEETGAPGDRRGSEGQGDKTSPEGPKTGTAEKTGERQGLEGAGKSRREASAVSGDALRTEGMGKTEGAQKAGSDGETAGASGSAKSPSSQKSPSDAPLPVLVNGEHPIREDYEMKPRLYSEVIVDVQIYDPLTELIRDAGKEGLTLWVASGYRSVADQERLFQRAVEENQSQGMSRSESRALAGRTIAQPGHSEHHTGLAVDFNTVSPDFADTEEYAWLQENAASYGFIQRYPMDKADLTGIDEEVWHYRYVGVAHAEKMTERGLCLEEYLAAESGD